MRRRLLILLILFVTLSCKDRLQLIENESIEVIESDEVYISQIPREIKMVNDSLIAFVDDNKSILLLNTNSGELEQEIVQNFDYLLQENQKISL